MDPGEKRKLRCPRCGRVSWLDPDEGGFAGRCPSCGGTHLSPEEARQVLEGDLGLTPEELRRAARKTPDEPIGPCPTCEGRLSTAALEGGRASLCLRCGAVWLDAGELERLTGGRIAERRPPDERARSHLPKAISPIRGAAVTRLPPFPWYRRLAQVFVFFALLVSGVFFPVAVVMLPLLPLAFRNTSGVLVDRPRRRLKRLTRYVFDFADSTVSFDDARAFRVWAEGPRRYVVALMRKGDVPPLRLVRVKDRVQAHRLAFQLSQLTELPVETPSLPAKTRRAVGNTAYATD